MSAEERLFMLAHEDQRHWALITRYFAYPLWARRYGRPIACNAAYLRRYPEQASQPGSEEER